MVKHDVSVFRNFTVAFAFGSFVLAALSLGGGRAPWSVFDGSVSVGTANAPVAYEIGVLRQRQCLPSSPTKSAACVAKDTEDFGEDCDGTGKAAASFVVMGLLSALFSTAIVMFAALRKGFLSSSFVVTIIFYIIAIMSWEFKCHRELEDAITASSGGAAVTDVTHERGIGFGAILAATLSSFLALLFMCCSPGTD